MLQKSLNFLFRVTIDTLCVMTHHTKTSFGDLLESQWFWIACLILAWQLFTLTFIQSFGSISLWPWLGKTIAVHNPGMRMPGLISAALIVLWAGAGIAAFAVYKKHVRQKFLAAISASSIALVVLALIFREIYPTLLYIILLPVQNTKYTFSLYAIHRMLIAALLAIGFIGSMAALKAKQSTLRIVFVILMIIVAGLLYTHYKFGIEDCRHLC